MSPIKNIHNYLNIPSISKSCKLSDLNFFTICKIKKIDIDIYIYCY